MTSFVVVIMMTACFVVTLCCTRSEKKKPGGQASKGEVLLAPSVAGLLSRSQLQPLRWERWRSTRATRSLAWGSKSQAAVALELRTCPNGPRGGALHPRPHPNVAATAPCSAAPAPDPQPLRVLSPDGTSEQGFSWP